MNKAQRKRLGEIETILLDVKCELDGMADEEQEKFDNLSEGLQASERGQTFEANSEFLKEMVAGLDDALNGLESIV